MRVLHVTTVPLSLMFLHGQADYMRARGIELIAVSSPGAELEDFGARERVAVHGVEMRRQITPLRDLATLARLWRLFRELDPDIVHAHTPKGGLLGTIAATLAGVPVRIYHMRGLPLMGATGGRRALLTATERVSCALATRILAVSRSLREVAIAEGLCDAKDIEVLAGGSGQGVDATGRFDPSRVAAGTRERVRAKLGIAADAVVFGFVGRIVRDKGVGELARAWRKVREEVPGAHLVMVGPFEPHDPIDEADKTALEGDPRIHFLGMRKDTPDLYAAMDVVVLPTYREGFPNVPLEAAAMSLPVIATQIPGCVDAVSDGVTGSLVPARDADALGLVMLRYGRDGELRRAHGAAGRERVLREFRRERICEELARTYAELTGRPAPAAPITREVRTSARS